MDTRHPCTKTLAECAQTHGISELLVPGVSRAQKRWPQGVESLSPPRPPERPISQIRGSLAAPGHPQDRSSGDTRNDY